MLKKPSLDEMIREGESAIADREAGHSSRRSSSPEVPVEPGEHDQAPDGADEAVQYEPCKLLDAPEAIDRVRRALAYSPRERRAGKEELRSDLFGSSIRSTHHVSSGEKGSPTAAEPEHGLTGL